LHYNNLDDRKIIDGAVWEEGWRDGQNFFTLSNDASYITTTHGSNHELACIEQCATHVEFFQSLDLTTFSIFKREKRGD
jgi:hypothetical protein